MYLITKLTAKNLWSTVLSHLIFLKTLKVDIIINHHLMHNEIKAQRYTYSNLYKVLQLFFYSRAGIYVHAVWFLSIFFLTSCNIFAYLPSMHRCHSVLFILLLLNVGDCIGTCFCLTLLILALLLFPTELQFKLYLSTFLLPWWLAPLGCGQ